MSELDRRGPRCRATIDVSYQPEALSVCLFRSKCANGMRTAADKSRIDGVATYGRFRQFQVKVDEKIGPSKK